jgi:L-ribulose-5-phosphate 4-epimerase
VSEETTNLREQVYRANLELVEAGLVLSTFGNVSGLDHATGVFFIKPSGVAYEELSPSMMVPVSLETGEPLERGLRPSSDTPVQCMGTTHADYFRGDVPLTRDLTPEEIEGSYETHVGLVITETFRDRGISPLEVPGVLVASHGPFTWGTNPGEAVKHSLILEYVARLECRMRAIQGGQDRPSAHLVDRHFRRKHGSESYYGQE